MIIDTLAQWRTYAALSPRLAKGFAFLETVTPSAALGRHEIDGDDVFALVQRYTTKPIEERVFESHRKYIDIQYVLQGREVMCWAPLPLLPVVTMPYDDKQDAALYALSPHRLALHVSTGQYTVFFPEDGHIPACAWDVPAEVGKVVVKVRV